MQTGDSNSDANVLNRQLSDFLQTEQLLNKTQSGFRRGHSCSIAPG